MRKLIYFVRAWCPTEAVGFVPGFWRVVGWLPPHLQAPEVVQSVDEVLLGDPTIGVARGFWNMQTQTWESWSELRTLGRWPNPGPELERARALCAA